MSAEDDDTTGTHEAFMEELSALRQENHDLSGINATLRQELAVARLETGAVSRRERYLMGYVDQLKLHIGLLDDKIQQLKDYIDQLNEKIDQLHGYIDQLHDTIHALHASFSWRVTKPLRGVRRRWRAFWGKDGTRQETQVQPETGPEEQQAVVSDVQPETSADCQENIWETIGVFVHLYYDDLAPELAGYINRIEPAKRVYISTDTSDKAARIREAFATAGLEQETDVRVFPNRGFDIGPFLVGFAAEIGQHALILRLHGKKSAHLGEAAGTAWRQLLLDSLLGSPERIQAILAAFQHFPNLGLVCPEHWDGLYQLYDAPIAIGSNLTQMAALLARYDVPLAAGTPIDFPSGSMFWCRSQALAPWLRFGFSWESFEESGDEARDASLAHALERSFLFGCGLERLTWARANQLPTAEGE